MNHFISILTADQLKDWGCKVESRYCWKPDIFGDKGWIIVEYPEENFFPKTYDLLKIISDGEMAKAFFGDSYQENCFKILALLQQNKQQEAEEYLLENCVWNSNK
jgi:hypothetical protein